MSKNSPTSFHDEKLGAALRRLDVPDHAPGFFRELEHRLAGEHRRIRARRRPPRRRLRWSLGIAVVAAAAAVFVVAIGIPRTGKTPQIAGPAIASAAEIKARVQASLTAMRNLSGVLVSDGPRKGDAERWRFVLTARGDLRLEGPGADEVITYDATAGVTRSAQRSASIGSGPLFYAERRGVAPGPPDQGPPTSILQRQLGSFVRALLAANDPRVREVAYDDRPAWQLDVDAVPNAIVPEFSGDRLEITVDRETGIPVRVVERRRDSFLREIRIEALAVDSDLAPRTFRLAFPPGAEVMRSDEGFRRVRDIPETAGYALLRPDWIPDGYKLAQIAVAKEAGPTGTEAGNPPSRMVVSLSYRRGLEQFLVTARLAQGGPWSDPLATGEGFVDHPEAIAIRGGALQGAKAELLIAPRAIPHLWALTDELVVTVGGDLGRDELLRVTESLRRRG
jgi:hypothetical protein